MIANELRIGNWVNIGSIGAIQWQKDDYVNYSGYDGRDENYISDKVEPIPLTHEILERCGFEKDDSISGFSSDEKERVIFSIKNFYISFEDDKFYMWNYCDDDYYSYSYPLLKHLHQLQNLYFALTGEELEIKELVKK